ncbi:MAG: HDOD domain-containing protein [Planctomycetaceae bacterium]
MDTGQIKVEQLAETASQLPPLSQTTSQIIAILADPLFEVSELIKVIALDQPLTASLLRSANSASHSRTRAAATVGEAVIRLGSGTILVMAVVTSARPKSDVDLHAFGMSADDYWEHCVSSVAASEELSARRIARFGSGFSTAALLHDYGKLILSEHITPEQLAAFQSSNPARRPVDAERTVLGGDHAVAGALVARHWNLPETMVTAIEAHHNAVDAEDDLTNGVILANQIALTNAGRTDSSSEAIENVANARRALGVDDEVYRDVAVASQVRFENLVELFA